MSSQICPQIQQGAPTLGQCRSFQGLDVLLYSAANIQKKNKISKQIKISTSLMQNVFNLKLMFAMKFIRYFDLKFGDLQKINQHFKYFYSFFTLENIQKLCNALHEGGGIDFIT